MTERPSGPKADDGEHKGLGMSTDEQQHLTGVGTIIRWWVAGDGGMGKTAVCRASRGGHSGQRASPLGQGLGG